MATWRERLSGLLGAPVAKPRPKVAKPTEKLTVANSPRAKLIAEAIALHRTVGAPVREVLDNALSTLERDPAKALRDPDALARMLSIMQARKVLSNLMAGDLKQYLVPSRGRQSARKDGASESGKGESPVARAPTKALERPKTGAKTKITRR